MKNILLLAAIMSAGCELAETIPQEPVAQAAVAQPAAATPAATPDAAGDAIDTASAEQAEWDNIAWKGPVARGATQVMTLSASIDSGRSKVSFQFSSYPWGGRMGLGHFFVWNGSRWEGGKFDWIRGGGQSVKLLENVHHGYNGLRAPASGTPVAFAWTDADGKQRSNLARTVWP